MQNFYTVLRAIWILLFSISRALEYWEVQVVKDVRLVVVFTEFDNFIYNFYFSNCIISVLLLHVFNTYTFLCLFLTLEFVHQVHKRMTLEQLKSIFHVESQDLVPHYEVIHLTHHGTAEHKISKRSVATASSASSLHQNNQFNDASTIHKSDSHHVKKDLSKSAYYSEIKNTFISLPVSSKSALKSTKSIISDLNHTNSNSSTFSSNNQSKLVRNSLSNSESDVQSGNQYKSQFIMPSELTSVRESDYSDSDEKTKQKPFVQLDLSNIKEHNVSLSVFGQVLNLTLRPTTQLFKNGPQSLQMFSVNASPNATHGLNYQPIEEVRRKNINFSLIQCNNKYKRSNA